MLYIDKYVQMFKAKGQKYEIVDNQLFVRQKQWIMPCGPSSQAYRLNSKSCNYILKKLGGLWVMWTDGFLPCQNAREWYSVICSRHTSVDELASSKRRNEIRRALKECEVRRVAIEEIACHGYETYCAAILRYNASGQGDIPTQEKFSQKVMTDKPFADIRHQWAVYHEGKMIAFAQNLIFDKEEVNYSLIKLHPQYLKHYPAYALIYRMNEYYLQEQGFSYVNDGFRSISHDTGIQDFLIKKFGFEKAYTGLHMHYRPPFGCAMALSRPFRCIASKVFPPINTLFKLDQISRNAHCIVSQNENTDHE